MCFSGGGGGGGFGGGFGGLGGKPSAEAASRNVFGSTSFGAQSTQASSGECNGCERYLNSEICRETQPWPEFIIVCSKGR